MSGAQSTVHECVVHAQAMDHHGSPARIVFRDDDGNGVLSSESTAKARG